MKKLAVVVGRFQTPFLHKGHMRVLEVATAQCDNVLVLLGCTGGFPDSTNPLSFNARNAMIRKQFPDCLVDVLFDEASDKSWSSSLDALVDTYLAEQDVLPNGDVLMAEEAILFVGRDSFLPRYSGRFPAVEVTAVEGVSGTFIRENFSIAQFERSKKFRAGMISARRNDHPTSFQAVDVACFRQAMGLLPNQLLLGRKAGEEKWRFPGGFVSPADSSLEAAALRELWEEVGAIETSGITYIGSFRIDDFRYRKSPHKVMSALFSCSYVFGAVKAADDLAEVAWFDLPALKADTLMPAHQPLFRALQLKKGF